ncbi:ArgE/DapE family deacylase [Ideonella sp. A 288]|uniref:M20 family metallopeptidase n=1 Tax=Ideonella sp. A 288 TaxID=1962181 RepID=UPI000B4C008C|nr:ArgE/DapE family deacylase [Ideonella sp. A 288]
MDTKTLNPLTERQILDAVAAQRDEAVALLCELVAQPSLLGDEAPAQALMRREFERCGLHVHEFAIDEDKIRNQPGYSPSIIPYDGRHNVVGVHRPAGPVRGRSLILNGHIDVVPVGTAAMWTSPPFEPRIDGDRLYGRGAADMKAGIVAYTMAFKALQRLGHEPAAPVFLQSVVEEECTGNGALACLVEGYTADAAIIPEPGEGVMTGQMGVMWLTIDVYGVPVHAAYAHTGVAAIGFANHLVDKLRELETEWNRPASRHPLYCGHEHPINFNLGRIAGGEWTSSVPTHCRVDMRLGFYPGVKPADVRTQVEALLAAAHDAHPSRASLRYEVSYHGFQAEGLVVDMQQPAIQQLLQCHHDITGSAAPERATTATTDVRFFHLYGKIPSTCYGPLGADIHGIDEWVSIASMQQVSAVLALFIARWCGLNPRAH